MKAWTSRALLSAVVLAALTSMPSAATAQMSPAPGGKPTSSPLRMHAARAVTKRLISRVVRFGDRLQGSEVRGCSRQPDGGVDCRAVAHGRSTKVRTVCDYKVAVTVRHRHPRGDITDHECEEFKLPHLGRRQAVRSIWAYVSQAAGPGAQFGALALGRTGQFEFKAHSDWRKELSARATELCALELRADLDRETNEVLIEVENFTCFTG